jgi:SAM-dependent methyltransferase
LRQGKQRQTIASVQFLLKDGMAEEFHWNQRYETGNTPWDTGLPSPQLMLVLQERGIAPCRALEIGCGTGTNCVWLAQQGFDVTGLDLAPLAIERAREAAKGAGVKVDFRAADILAPLEVQPPAKFFFDRGCYHAVRRGNPDAYAPAVHRLLADGAMGLVLAGKPRPPDEPGPPTVTEAEIRDELGGLFEIVELREFRFVAILDTEVTFLGWSCLLRKRG